MKSNRTLSFIIITAVYILAAAVGIYTYNICPGEIWLRLLIADIAATVFTFAFSVAFGNASVYDPYWSVQPIVILAAFAVGDSFNIAKLLLLFAVGFWAVRLTANWAYTFHGLNHQDWRYTMLHEKTGIFYPVINFIGIHMVPSLVVYLCIMPGVYVMCADVDYKPLCSIGFLISILAVFLQGTADIQMQKYRKNKNTPFIETGVWKYSRHPNYLAEILMWWGVAAFTVALLGFEWYFISGAVANTLLFLCVSIPLADGRQSKKEGFEEYKKRTRMLLLLPK